MSDEDIPCVRKFESPLRWLILVLVCVMFVGSYYCLETPAALKTQLKEYMGSEDDYETKFQLLYTLYSAPNVILPIFGGVIIDRIGARKSLVLFMLIVTVAQLVFMIGLSQKSWSIMLFARFLFGVGNESFIIANSTILTHWFCGTELALAFGINTTTARLGSVVNNILSIHLIESAGLLFAFWFGALMVVACLVIVLVTVAIDKWMETGVGFRRVSQLDSLSVHSFTLNKIAEAPEDGEVEMVSPSPCSVTTLESRDDRELEWAAIGEASPIPTGSSPPVKDDGTSAPGVRSLPLLFWVVILTSSMISACIVPFNSISSSLLLERDYFRAPPQGCSLEAAGCQSDANQPNGVCPSSVWVQPPLPYGVSVAGANYSQVSPADVDCLSDAWRGGGGSTVGCTQEYCARIAAAESRASYVMSIPYILGAVLSPVIGLVVDRIGKRAIISILSALAVVTVHSLLALTSCSPLLPLVVQGLAVCGISVLWSSAVLIVDPQVTGLALGIFGSVLNFFWAATPLAIALVYNQSGQTYIPSVELLFVAMSGLGLVLAVAMNHLDGKTGGVLNSVCAPDKAVSVGH